MLTEFWQTEKIEVSGNGGEVMQAYVACFQTHGCVFVCHVWGTVLSVAMVLGVNGILKLVEKRSKKKIYGNAGQKAA